MKKAGLVALLLVVLLFGCARQNKLVIGVIPKGQAHIFWQTVHAGAAAAAQELGVQIRWNGPAMENEFARQVQIVE